MDYVHLQNLAPRNGDIDWNTYETRFLDLMSERRIEREISREILDDGCLLCSEDSRTIATGDWSRNTSMNDGATSISSIWALCPVHEHARTELWLPTMC